MIAGAPTWGPEQAVRVDGVYRWNGFLDADRVEALQRTCAALLDSGTIEVQTRSIRLWNLFAHGPEFTDLLLDRRLQALCGGLLGDGCLLSDYSINAVYPGARQDPWHVDYPYNEVRLPVQSQAPLGLQCILAIDALDEHNGATQYIRDSHRAASRPVVDGPTLLATQHFDGRPGDLLVMHAATWHRAGLNRTSGLRVAVVLSFVPRWIRPIIAPRDVAAVLRANVPEELRVLLGAVVFEEIDSTVVRREVV